MSAAAFLRPVHHNVMAAGNADDPLDVRRYPESGRKQTKQTQRGRHYDPG
jgi:hypothetical protein